MGFEARKNAGSLVAGFLEASLSKKAWFRRLSPKVGFLLKVKRQVSESLGFSEIPVVLLLLKKAAASVCTAQSKLSSRAVALVFSSK